MASDPDQSHSQSLSARLNPHQNDSFGLRLASGAILGSVTLLAVYFGGAIYSALVAFMVVIMCFEWARMIFGAGHGAPFSLLAFSGAVAIALASAGEYGIGYLVCILAGVPILTFRQFSRSQRLWGALGVIYFLVPSIALLWIRAEVENGRGISLMLFAIVWAADSGAYGLGRLVGGPRLSPVLSPAKTWSGAIGGAALGALAGVIAAPVVFPDAALPAMGLMGASLGLASILGDMCESGFKRYFGVKDMSGFIPGHGGVLDRLDGMIFATTAMAAVLYGQILLGLITPSG
ncbi:MAG: phosphatidate cytidylyltransferase [Parvularculaceae bacterium]